MENGFYVYEHSRSDTGAIFYVGKGKKDRAYSKYGRNEYWKRIERKANGFDVKIVAKELEEELAFLVEIERIAQLRQLGFCLTNLTDGGDGNSGYRFTDEQKEKLSKSCKERAKDPKVRLARSLAVKGVPWSEARWKASGFENRNKKYETRSKKGSEEDRLRKSIALKSKPPIVCPHCGKEGRGNAMKQWHLDRCKEKE